MQVGLIGLGKMGYHLGLQMIEKNYDVWAYDIEKNARAAFRAAGGKTTSSIAELIGRLSSPKVVMTLVPAGDATDAVLEEAAGHLVAGDFLIDAGNSHYKRSLKNHQKMAQKGIHFFDVGTSGGIRGAREGACFMIGGDAEKFPVIEPLFRDLAVENGYLYCGKGGSGHYLKMIHNGIEYGMMAAIGEGFELLEKSPFDYNFSEVAKLWNNGSVIRGWLMELTEQAFRKDPRLKSLKGVMHSSGEGKWTVETALDLQTCAPIIALSLMMRYRSQEEDTFTGKVVAALRHEFGGHQTEKM